MQMHGGLKGWVLGAMVSLNGMRGGFISIELLVRETTLDYRTLQCVLRELSELDDELFRSVHDPSTKDILCVTHVSEAALRKVPQPLPEQRTGGSSHPGAQHRGFVGRLVRSVGGAVIARFIADWVLDTYHR